MSVIKEAGPIGIFDSGYGGLSVLREIRKELPQYNYLYLGDNARAPYGSLSFEVIYQYTLQAVKYLFNQGCNLVILACNTASAKALRTIQQKDLPCINPQKRVLGIIRPTAEKINHLTQSKHVGILGTMGTIQSQSYTLEIQKLYPEIQVFGQACPMWVPLVEYGEYDKDGADYFVQKYLQQLLSQDALIDTIILACTHYPLLYEKIRKHCPQNIQLMVQGSYIAQSLKDYLKRHPEIDHFCTKEGQLQCLTTEEPEKFKQFSKLFLGKETAVQSIKLS